jgi:hypothetical protein
MLGHGYKSMERKGGRWTVTLDAGGVAKTVEAEAGPARLSAVALTRPFYPEPVVPMSSAKTAAAASHSIRTVRH